MNANDLAEKAKPGLHNAAFEVLRRFCPPPGRVLDLGAGTGSWTCRLTGTGYTVTPVDRDPDDWGLSRRMLLIRNLNCEFSEGLGGPFDAISCLEVIEHLENPWLFLRECRKLVSPQGIILLTTPNIENVAGRLGFLRTGHFRGFGRDTTLNDPTHITPIQSYLFEKMCAAAQLTLAWQGFNRATESTRGGLKRVLLHSLRRFMSGVTGGDNHIFVLKKES